MKNILQILGKIAVGKICKRRCFEHTEDSHIERERERDPIQMYDWSELLSYS